MQVGQKWKHNELIDAGLNKKQADFVLKAQSKGFQIGSSKNGEHLRENQAQLLDLINTDNLSDKTMREFNANFDKGR